MRINKYISHYTKYSRRDADELIKAGEVKLGRQILNDLSYTVQPEDNIFVKGRLVEKRTEITVIVYNKPKGVLVTKQDDRGRATIYHKLSGKYRHFIPVGRLDYASEGLLILTDAPRVAEVLMNSSLPRVYNIKIDKPFTQEMAEAMRNGLELEDAKAGGHEKSSITNMSFAPFENFEIRSEGSKSTKLRVTINEGKNRELRRFFAHFDAKVLDLKRVAYGEIELNNLPTNKTRYFTRKEYDDLHKFLKEKTKEEKKTRHKEE
ncbi:MAG: pseudouridine synthase [Sulfurovaceae bacterium]|nr:pseudouridine synthase [Sulfurovaceae bacterium]